MALIQAVIFDLDGTLVDTEPAAAHAVNSSFADWGINITPEDATYITGRKWESAFAYLFKKYPVPIDHKLAGEQMLQRYREALEDRLVIVPGAAEAVSSLAGKYPLGLVSGSYRSEIFFALRKLGVEKHFKVVLGAEDYAHGKPAPDGFLKALQALGTRPENALIFEDSTAGIASARAAGAWVIAIAGTNHYLQDTSQAHLHIPDLLVVDAAWIAQLKLSG